MTTVNEVVSKVNSFSLAREHYRHDSNLSPTGIERALKNLGQEEQAYRITALEALRSAWALIRLRYKQIDLKNSMEEVTQAKAWDYSRLNYMADAVKAKINASNRAEDVTKWYTEGLQSGDTHKARAYAEAGASTLRLRFHDLEANSLATQGDKRLIELLDSPVYHEVQKEGEALIKDVQTLFSQHKTVHEFYRPLITFYDVPDDFDKLTEGVSLTTKWDSDKVMFKTTLEVTDAPAGKAEGQVLAVKASAGE